MWACLGFEPRTWRVIHVTPAAGGQVHRISPADQRHEYKPGRGGADVASDHLAAHQAVCVLN